ncbi:MAG: DNA mismatch repair protein MutS, partial [Vicinamibacteria bacterium]|nr:DNA mismatch repair protein MutS [Vicinamibacteria bacterium]
MTLDPQTAYASRLETRRAEAHALERRDSKLSLARGVVGVIGLVAALTMSSSRPVAIAVFGGSLLAFFALIVIHERVARHLARARRRVAFFDGALSRTRGEWAGKGEPGTRFLDPAHPNAIDLDLFGRGSLYERICVARTHAGQDRLASWLKSGASIEVLKARQAAGAEVGVRVDLREDLFVLGAEARRAVDSTSLLDWLTAPPVPIPARLRVAAFGSSVAAFISAAAWALDVWDGFPFRVAFIAVLVCTWFGRVFSREVLTGIGRPVHDLQTLTELFDRLGAERFEAPRLVELRESLAAEGVPPARPIAQLRRWLEIHESKSNVFFGVLSFFMVWDLQLAGAVEAWRRRFGAPAALWLSTLGEMEALVSLGTYAFENPGDPYPTFEVFGPFFHADGISHPLLPASRAVANDVRLDGQSQMLVVTGSNMSGKSTLLRTVGINAVLALSGAPVRAASLRLSPLAVGASIRVQDSLQDGESRFYAEIKRVRQVLDLASGPIPALFLMDEIFDGTNSAERRVGAEAVVRSLLERKAIGLVTSHDLALAEIAVSLAPNAANVHFEDHLEG